jgi:peptidoglycan/LPS O-acetylase OafA/YrhL
MPAGASGAGAVRLSRLDALRGVAFLSVFVFHAFLELNTGDGGWVGAVYSNPYGFLFPHHLGALGVQLFFVLSGFCIHRSAERGLSASGSWADYARRRALRIVPLYLLTLVAFYALTSHDPLSGEQLGDLALHAAFLQTLVPGHVNHINPAFWSLAVEVQLYALYPLLWLASQRLGARRAVLLFALASLFWALVLPQWARGAWFTQLPLRWGFAWFLGVGVAVTLRARFWPGGRATALFLGATLLALLPSRSVALYEVLPPLAFAGVVAWAARQTAPERPGLGFRALVALGGISYALYLMHQPLLTFAGRALTAAGVRIVDAGPFFATAGGVLLGCIALATPLERLGRRVQAWGERRLSAAAAASGRRKPDVGWAPTPEHVARAGLEWVGLRPGERVVELGGGDARVAVVAARAGAQVLCVELDPALVAKARKAVRAAGVSDRVELVQGDLFEVDLSSADVVFMFLLPSLNDRLLPTLRRQLKPGARILSREFEFSDWPAEETLSLPGFTLYAWRVPDPADAVRA